MKSRGLSKTLDQHKAWLAAASLAVALLTVSTQSVQADEFHYENFRFGQDAMGMGGAVVSFIHAPEATFYNPAGLAFMQGSGVSGALHFYGLDQRNLVEGYKTGGFFPSEDLSSSAFLALPASSVISFRLGRDHVLAYSTFLMIDENESFPGQISIDDTIGGVDFRGNTTIGRQFEDRVLLLGPTYAYRASDALSIGLSVFFARRDQDTRYSFGLEYDALEFNDEPHKIITQEETVTSSGDNALLASLGVQIKPFDNVMLGLTVSTQSLSLGGTGNLSHVSRFSGNTPDDPNAFDDIRSASDIEATSVFPWAFTLGIGYEKPDLLRVGLDVSVHLPVEYERLDLASDPELQALVASSFINTVIKEMVINPKVGAELQVSNEWSIRAGFFTNLSAAPEIAERPSALAFQHIDLFGTTFSIGYEGGGKSVTIGADLQWGAGEDTVFRDSFNFETTRVDRVQREHLRAVFFLSGAFEFLEETASEFLPGGDLIGAYKDVKNSVGGLGGGLPDLDNITSTDQKDLDNKLNTNAISQAPMAEQLGLLLARDQLNVEAERSLGAARSQLAEANAVNASALASTDYESGSERLKLAESAMEEERFATAIDHAQNAAALLDKATRAASPGFEAQRAAMTRSHATLSLHTRLQQNLSDKDDTLTLNPTGTTISLAGLFSRDSADTLPERQIVLDEIAASALAFETFTLTIQGLTTPKEAKNTGLPRERAQAIKALLSSKGVPEARIRLSDTRGDLNTRGAMVTFDLGAP